MIFSEEEMSLKPMAVSHADKPLKSPESLAVQDDHLSSLKALTEKLKLETGKPSSLDWRAQLEEMLAQSHRVSETPGDTDKHKTSGPLQRAKPSLEAGVIHKGRQPLGNRLGFGSIDQALEWLKKDLVSFSSLFLFK